MKRPNLAWRNHCIFSSCDLGEGSGLAPGCATAASTESSTRQTCSGKIWEIPLFIDSLLGESPLPHKKLPNSSERLDCESFALQRGGGHSLIRFTPGLNGGSSL